MEEFEMTIPCLFGLESFVTREIKDLGLKHSKTEDGKVSFLGDYEDMIRANLWIRTGERVLIKLSEFTAYDFDTFYDYSKNAPWKNFLPFDAQIKITGTCVKSKLSSSPRCRAILKKAIADSLCQGTTLSHIPETGNLYHIRFTLLKDKVSLYIDTSGESLHKRGYRRISNAAPLRETIAAAMVSLSRWHSGRILADPFCGSGTIAIEAAMKELNIAPGINRGFEFENFDYISSDTVNRLKEEAKAKTIFKPLEILASDINPEYVDIAAQNAQLAGVSEYIKPYIADAVSFSSVESNGVIICNPPYGERMSTLNECRKLYSALGKTYQNLNGWSCFIITSDEDFEKYFAKRSDKERKIYNGMIKCRIYQYYRK